MQVLARLNPKRWLRWLATGLLSAATPLPWLVDVTSQGFDALERRVSQLEDENAALARYIDMVTREARTVAPDQISTRTSGSGVTTWTTLS